jgi:hypothetical protein
MIVMGEVYTVRDMDEKTRAEIQTYAHKHGLKISQAIRELVVLAKEHIQHTKNEKKYKSMFDVYEKVKFKGGKDLSKQIDEVVYG